MDHVLIRPLEFLGGTRAAPSLRFGVELRDRPGPLHKHGAFEDDRVWVQLEGGLIVARAVVRICWVGEYSEVESVRARTRGSALHDLDGFWRGRPRYGYAGLADLAAERWVEPMGRAEDLRVRVGAAGERERRSVPGSTPSLLPGAARAWPTGSPPGSPRTDGGARFSVGRFPERRPPVRGILVSLVDPVLHAAGDATVAHLEERRRIRVPVAGA